MELSILGSSSDGNCYIIQNETEALVIECGVSFTAVKKALDFNISKVVGALVSHEHGDHANYINDFLNARIPTYMSAGTLSKLNLKSKFQPSIIEAGVIKRIGNFLIHPFMVKHDAKEPFGFFINHPETGNVLFATDTYFLPNRFANLNNILIEANYRTDLLKRNIEAGRVPSLLRDRTLQSHMSFETCKEALLANDLSQVNNIVLIHLSDGNSNYDEFQRDMYEATGKTIHIADAGMKIQFDKTPF
jgi:phosphoribosyl 1,2-cyclic phosphodiesterase